MAAINLNINGKNQPGNLSGLKDAHCLSFNLDIDECPAKSLVNANYQSINQFLTKKIKYNAANCKTSRYWTYPLPLTGLNVIQLILNILHVKSGCIQV